MNLSRVHAPKTPGDYGQVWVSQSIDASKPDGMRNVRGLFERQTTAQRRSNAYKASASRMAQRFAKGV